MTENTIDRETDGEIDFMNIDGTDFSCFSLGQQIRHLEVEGYVVLPGVIGAEQIDRIKAQMADAPMQTKDYSEAQTYHMEPQWYSKEVAELIGNPKVTDFLKVLFGDDIVFTHGLLTRTLAGSPPISLHTDGQPFGSSIFGYEGSSPRLLRILYYLDDLVPERAPFRLVPRSHLSFHAQANPYVRYHWHPGEITLCPKAGTAVIIPINMFHGTHPNKAASSRTLVQLGYRPAWAGPIQPMEEWDPELVAAAPEPEHDGTGVGTGAQTQGHEDGGTRHRSGSLGEVRGIAKAGSLKRIAVRQCGSQSCSWTTCR